MAKNNTWVKEFFGQYPATLRQNINEYCAKYGYHPLSISVVNVPSIDYVALVVLEKDTEEGSNE